MIYNQQQLNKSIKINFPGIFVRISWLNFFYLREYLALALIGFFNCLIIFPVLLFLYVIDLDECNNVCILVIFVSIVVIGTNTDQQSSNGLVILKLWKDGFTINDSEIRSYEEPENREFLAAIKRGEVPAEIRQQVQGTDLRLDMEDHRHESYIPTKAKVKAFTGKGHMLGRYTRYLFYCYPISIYDFYILLSLLFQSIASYCRYDSSHRSCRPGC